MVKLSFFAKKKKEQISPLEFDPKGPDSKGYHTVRCHDGVNIKFRLLLGGPNGDNQFDPSKRTAICLHGIGDSSETWSTGFFRTKDLDMQEVGRILGTPETVEIREDTQDTRRRSTMIKNLAKQVNVVLMDQRGFGISGRPTTDRPFKDSATTIIGTYTIENGQAFNQAVQKYVTDCSYSGKVMNCHVSVSGSTAVVRTSYMRPFHLPFTGNFVDDASPEKGFLEGAAALQEMHVVAMEDEWGVVDQLWPPTFLESPFVKRTTRMTPNFTRDRKWVASKEPDVTLYRRFKLMKKTNEAFTNACAAVVAEFEKDSGCLSFSFLQGARGFSVLATCAGVDAALQHQKAFSTILSSKDKDSFGKFVKQDWVQVHAKGPEIKKLKEIKEFQEKGVQLYQEFPLSFEHDFATTTGANMEDFAKDIESVLSHLGISKATILGHSMGAAIAIGHALNYPDSVDRLCTIGGAPRVGQAAYNNWMMQSGTASTWEMNVVRGSAVALANYSDQLLSTNFLPTLLANAEDDKITALLGSQMLKAVFPNSMLFAPEWGGHNFMTFNDEATERIVLFLAEESPNLSWAEDKLMPEILSSRWGLYNDAALMNYYYYGSALADVEAAERRLRLIQSWVANMEYEDELELGVPYDGETHPEALVLKHDEISARREERQARIHEEQKIMLAALRKVGAERSFHGYPGSPRDFLLDMMTDMLGKMSGPGKQAVENAGPWWRDTGKATKNWNPQKYTVDLFGRRRGGSKKTGCAWYRWDVNNICRDVRDGMVPMEVRQNEENFRCWWCGADPGDHEDLGPAGENEEPSFFPGPGSDGRPWQKPVFGVYVADEEEEDEYDPVMDGGGAPFQRIDLKKVDMTSTEKALSANRIMDNMKPKVLFGKSGYLVPVVD